MNIWFLRMDIDSLGKFDLSKSYQFVHSLHGICSGMDDIIKEHKHKIFPELTINELELTELIYLIKDKLIELGLLDLNQTGKQRCDLAIRYWILTMAEGDFIFVRNTQGKVFLCKITGYISEEFFDENGCFQRPVDILCEITESIVTSEIWNRTQGRKTIERNAQQNITDWVLSNYEKLIQN